MIPMLRSLAIAGLMLIPLACAPALAADAAATINVDALHRGHGPGDDPHHMDVSITTDQGRLLMVADIEDPSESDAEREGQPAKAWSATLRMAPAELEMTPMRVGMVEYTSLDGRRLGSTARHADGSTTESIIVRTHPLPKAAKPGDEGMMYEGTETRTGPDGEIVAQFFDESWSAHPAVDGEPRLHFTRRELDSSQQVRNQIVSEYAVTADGKLRLLVARGTEVVGPRMEMVFTPR